MQAGTVFKGTMFNVCVHLEERPLRRVCKCVEWGIGDRYLHAHIRSCVWVCVCVCLYLFFSQASSVFSVHVNLSHGFLFVVISFFILSSSLCHSPNFILTLSLCISNAHY